MNLTTARARFDSYVLNEDTVDPAVSTTVRDLMINEAYLEVHAKLGVDFKYTADVVSAAASFNFGLSGDGIWLEIMQVEVKVGAVYVPLARGKWRAIHHLQRTEGLTGQPREAGLGLVSRNIVTGQSIHNCAVYPTPAGSTSYRARIRSYAPELVNGADIMRLDENMADGTVRGAAWRAGSVLGYSQQWRDNLIAAVPDQVLTALEIGSRAKYVQPGASPPAAIA